MNINVSLFPLEKVVIDGTSICLGMKKSLVEAAIGTGQLIGKRNYYYNSEMAIDYNEENTVEFVEFLGGIDSTLRPAIYGVSVFDTNASELVEVLLKNNGVSACELERGHSYLFPKISVGIYRDITPSDVLDMIEEMKANDIPTDNNEDIVADMRRAEYWGTIGIGVAGYYRC